MFSMSHLTLLFAEMYKYGNSKVIPLSVLNDVVVLKSSIQPSFSRRAPLGSPLSIIVGQPDGSMTLLNLGILPAQIYNISRRVRALVIS